MLEAIPALNDNYIWIYGREDFPVIIVDLPETKELFAYLDEYKLQPAAVLLTHCHDDHTAGVAEFKQKYPNVPIYGPSETEEKGATEIVNEGALKINQYTVHVIPSPGHTANHVSYYIEGHLFCGDTLFSAGCGRVLTGNYEGMFNVLQLFNRLSEDTIICPGHEYTLANLAFAETVTEHPEFLKQHKEFVESIRAEDLPSVPTYLSLEKQINPFLRATTLDEFIRLRKAKDNF